MKSVSVYAPMPVRVMSHVRYEGDGGDGFARFDITLCDETGRVFAEIAHFTMKRIDARSAIVAKAPRAAPVADPLEALLANAITPPEGVQALERALAQPHLVQTMISSVDAALWMRQLDAPVASVSDADDPDVPQSDLAGAAFAAPATVTERALAKLWSDLLGVRRISRDDDFFALGGNSLVGVRLFAAIRKQFGLALPMSVLFEASTLALLALRLGEPDAQAAPAAAQDAASLVCIQPGAPHRTPLFCVHGALGNVVGFKPLAVHLGADQPFYGLQAQGIDGVAAPLDSIADMARLYIRAIRTRQLQGPYLLAGYSGGGVIAHEMTRQLEAMGEETALLVLIDTLEPSQMIRPITHWDRARHLFDARPGQILRAARKRFARPVASTLAPTALELASKAVEQAYLRAQGVHAPAPVRAGLLLVRAREARMHFLRAGQTLGWDKWIGGRIEVIEADGNHETVCLEPAVATVAAALRARIDATASRQRDSRPAAQWQRAS